MTVSHDETDAEQEKLSNEVRSPRKDINEEERVRAWRLSVKIN